MTESVTERVAARLATPAWRAHRQPAGSVSATVAVLGLVALALVGERSWWFIGALLASVAAAVTFFHVAFPGTRFFAVAFANSLAAYACIFNFFVEANFKGVGTPVLAVGFAVPIGAFCLAAGARRRRIRAIIGAEEGQGEPRIAGALLWLLPVFAVGAATFALPRLGLGHPALEAAFLTSMAAIALTVLLVGPMVTLFLIDTGLLFEAFFEQANRVLVAAFAFLTFYSLLVIVFASLYRVLDLVSGAPNFMILAQPRDISFAESLYFSVITMATVGYGDVTPLSDVARLIVAGQVVVGILLLLFGFSEIITYARTRDR